MLASWGLEIFILLLLQKGAAPPPLGLKLALLVVVCLQQPQVLFSRSVENSGLPAERGARQWGSCMEL